MARELSHWQMGTDILFFLVIKASFFHVERAPMVKQVSIHLTVLMCLLMFGI